MRFLACFAALFATAPLPVHAADGGFASGDLAISAAARVDVPNLTIPVVAAALGATIERFMTPRLAIGIELGMQTSLARDSTSGGAASSWALVPGALARWYFLDRGIAAPFVAASLDLPIGGAGHTASIGLSLRGALGADLFFGRSVALRLSASIASAGAAIPLADFPGPVDLRAAIVWFP